MNNSAVAGAKEVRVCKNCVHPSQDTRQSLSIAEERYSQIKAIDAGTQVKSTVLSKPLNAAEALRVKNLVMTLRDKTGCTEKVVEALLLQELKIAAKHLASAMEEAKEEARKETSLKIAKAKQEEQEWLTDVESRVAQEVEVDAKQRACRRALAITSTGDTGAKACI
jgi:hypothetical protein